MTRHRTSLLAGIAAITLIGLPAQAIDINAGGVGVGVDVGGGSGVDANVNVDTGGGTTGGGGGGGGGGGTSLPGEIAGGTPSVAGAPADIDDGLIILPVEKDGDDDATTADIDVDLDGEGEDSITGAVDTGLGDADAVVRFSNTEDGTNIHTGTDLDAGGTSTEAMIDLTIGGGGVAGEATAGSGSTNGSLSINVGGGGVAGETTVGAADSEATLSINVGTGGVLDGLDLPNLTTSTATAGDTAAVPATPGTGVVPSDGLSLSASSIQSTFDTISEEDVAALKVNCRTILGDSSSYSANAVAICKLALGM